MLDYFFHRCIQVNDSRTYKTIHHLFKELQIRHIVRNGCDGMGRGIVEEDGIIDKM